MVDLLTVAANLSGAIDRLRHLTQTNIQAQWRYHPDLPIAQATQPEAWQQWPIADLNARDYIAWAAGQQILWLSQRVVVPAQLQGYPLAGLALRLSLGWWADAAQVFVDGQLVQEGDLFDCFTRILLSLAVHAGDEFDLALRLVSPGHDPGALVRSLCLYEVSPVSDLQDDLIAFPVEPSFVADELAVLQHVLTTFAPDRLEPMATALAQLDWTQVTDRPAFDRSLRHLRQTLLPLASDLQKQQILLLGHAHLDMAWLWPVSETWDAAERTFKSVLQLQQDFPALTFCHSTPALYAWVEVHRPALFAAIQEQIAAGKWEVVGAMWVEPELNLVNGESIVRQVLYGQRYCLEKFGQVNPIAWLPDSFGFSWQLPQILCQGGIDYFVTQKMRWNDTNPFPHEVFWWQGLDGSRIFSLMSAPIGEGIDPQKMIAYACNLSAKAGIQSALWLPGVGDHGGGPTRDMLEVAQRWQQSPFFPQMAFTRAIDYLHQLEASDEGKAIPIWHDELYLEFHRGCYTTHADQKRANRRSEALLYQAELFASLATLSAGVPYPHAELELAWKKMLFNQFHDILPGTAIPEVFADADRDWQAITATGTAILDAALETIAAQIILTPPHPDARALVVFNSLNWERSEVVAINLSEDDGLFNLNWRILNESGTPVEVQREPDRLLFFAPSIPAIGYRLFWLCPSAPPTPAPDAQSLAPDFILENERLRVTLDPTTGELASVFDKIQQREVLSGNGNQLQTFQDSGQYWDAWNIDPHYAQHPLAAAKLVEIYPESSGPLETRIRVLQELAQSRVEQTYILQKQSALLKIHTTVDWQAQHTLLKVAFPLNLTANYATYEIPCGAIERSTDPQTPTDQAKWEVPALQWADLGNPDYGVSLLNDCKYGYDAQPSQLRLTLLRSPNWPHPKADNHVHEFTYALYPHTGTWQSAHTVRQGYELNQPLHAKFLYGSNPAQPSLPPIGQLLDLQAENLILMALKQAEAESHQWILRCYECHGQPATLNLRSDLNLKITDRLDLLERSQNSSHQPDIREIPPWTIATFKLEELPNASDPLDYLA